MARRQATDYMIELVAKEEVVVGTWLVRRWPMYLVVGRWTVVARRLPVGRWLMSVVAGRLPVRRWPMQLQPGRWERQWLVK